MGNFLLYIVEMFTKTGIQLTGRLPSVVKAGRCSCEMCLYVEVAVVVGDRGRM